MVIFNQHLTFGGFGFAVRIVFQTENVTRVIIRAITRFFGKVVDSVPVLARLLFRGRSAYLSKMAGVFYRN
jgi:hypothetical protein